MARAEDARHLRRMFKRKVRECAWRMPETHGKKVHRALAGRPYHLDPEINHGIDKMITSFDMVVLTEDSVAATWAKLPRPIRVLRPVDVSFTDCTRRRTFVGTTDDVELIQLNSFGCGLDAVTTDQVEEITEKAQ